MADDKETLTAQLEKLRAEMDPIEAKMVENSNTRYEAMRETNKIAEGLREKFDPLVLAHYRVVRKLIVLQQMGDIDAE